MDTQCIDKAYDSSHVTFALLRACGWGLQLNLGFFRPWDLLLHPFRLDIAQERLTYRSMRLLRAQDGERILDVACGRGKSSFLLAMQHPSCHVTGLDFLEKNVQIANTVYAHMPNLNFGVGNAETLSRLEDGSFHKMHCLEAAFHFDRAKFLVQASRVLRNGGRLVIVDFIWRNQESRNVSPDAARIVKGTWQFEDFSTVEEYKKYADSAGFDLERLVDWSQQVTGGFMRRFWMLTRAGQNPILRKFMCRINPLLRGLDGSWEVLADAERAHKELQTRSRYVALAFIKRRG